MIVSECRSSTDKIDSLKSGSSEMRGTALSNLYQTLSPQFRQEGKIPFTVKITVALGSS